MSSACADELKTLHHRGFWHSHGPVKHTETVVFAVFGQHECDGARLAPSAFATDQLKKGELSVARASHTSCDDFQKHVVSGAEAKGAFRGVVKALAGDIRALPYTVPGAHPPKIGKALCVIDIVEEDDHDGHAALKFSDAQELLTAKQKSQIRIAIKADLAETFGEICAPESVLRAHRNAFLRLCEKVVQKVARARDWLLLKVGRAV